MQRHRLVFVVVMILTIIITIMIIWKKYSLKCSVWFGSRESLYETSSERVEEVGGEKKVRGDSFEKHQRSDFFLVNTREEIIQ